MRTLRLCVTLQSVAYSAALRNAVSSRRRDGIRKNHQAKVTSPAADLHERQRRFGWSPLIVVALADGVLS